ncbi:MAG: hypothetical protein KJ847_05360 [Firmicutes bacterium]|nr:hypothetical protein [Bacillota bacterium]
MKNILIVLANIIVLIFICVFSYRAFIVDQNSEILVDCTPAYNTSTNEMIVACDIIDKDEIITESNPLVMTLYDAFGNVLLEHSLIEGENIITYDALFYNDQYSIIIVGENIIRKSYVNETFYTYDFSTIREDITIPTFSFSEPVITDTTLGFEITLTDDDALISDILIELYDQDDLLVDTDSVSYSSSISILFSNLSQQSDYYAVVTVTYLINDLNGTTTIFDTLDFTTLRTPLMPSAILSNLSNDYTTLQFDLAFNNEDAVDVTYVVEVLDINSNLLFTTIPTSETFIYDVSSILGNYYIRATASYTLSSETYTEEEIFRYYLYNNEYSNYFTIATLSRIDTSLPLTSYNDYEKYMFTYLDEGITEFTINCQAPVDCVELVENPLYSAIPFGISNFLHPYYDINAIAYSYTSNKIDFTTETRYSDTEIALVNDEVNSILNEIITDGMSDYYKILAVHDYIINNSSYDTVCIENTATCDNDHNALGILFDQNAVCEGYAQAMDIFLRALRIPSFRLSSETHQWNVTYYHNKWYHVDPTWDDPVTTDGSNILLHSYFLITTEVLHTLDDTDTHIYSTTYANFIE